MKNRNLFVILALSVITSMTLTGCFGQKKEEVVTEESTFPEADAQEDADVKAEEEASEEAETPEAQPNIYLSGNRLISIELPDVTWLNKTDEEDLFQFESPSQGSILISYNTGENAAGQGLPSTEEAAVSLEEAAQLKAGEDFELSGYEAADSEEGSVYSYQLKMLDPEKAGYAYVAVKIFADEAEVLNIRGTVKEDDTSVLEAVKAAIDSVGISQDSSLAGMSPMKEDVIARISDDESVTDGTEGVPSETTESEAAETDDSDGASASESVQGITPYRDNPDNTDTNLTRTVYRNSDGHPIVISADGNGNWVDEDGNVYRFMENNIDVYDQNDVDYYWHGEAADVYYMPIETGSAD